MKWGIVPHIFPTGGMKISAPDLAKYMTMHMCYGKITQRHKNYIEGSAKNNANKGFRRRGGYGLAIMTTDKIIPGKIMKGTHRLCIRLIQHDVLSTQREVWYCGNNQWL